MVTRTRWRAGAGGFVPSSAARHETRAPARSKLASTQRRLTSPPALHPSRFSGLARRILGPPQAVEDVGEDEMAQRSDAGIGLGDETLAGPLLRSLEIPRVQERLRQVQLPGAEA